MSPCTCSSSSAFGAESAHVVKCRTCLRLSRINMDRCPIIAAEAADWLLGSDGSHGARAAAAAAGY